MAFPTLLPVTKARLNARRRESPSHSKQDGGCVFPPFVQVCIFLCSWKCFIVVKKKNFVKYKGQSDLTVELNFT